MASKKIERLVAKIKEAEALVISTKEAFDIERAKPYVAPVEGELSAQTLAWSKWDKAKDALRCAKDALEEAEGK